MDASADDPDGGSDLLTSARGWQRLQLAVLGFIGLCGAIAGISGSSNPGWLQMVSGTLVVTALVLACSATVLVATVAWPVSTVNVPASPEARGRRRLRTGIALTYLSITLMALAATSSWWPKQASSLAVVTTSSGDFCGDLQESSAATLGLLVGGQRVEVPVSQVTGLRPVDTCP